MGFGHDGKTVYFCVDLEASGPVPGLFNMVSVAGVEVRWNGERHVRGETFYFEIAPDFPGFDPGAMKIHGLSEAHLRAHGRPGKTVMADIATWVKSRLKPGVTIRELTHGGHKLEDQYWKQKYSCKMHGVGLCDEWPFVPYSDSWVDGAMETALEPGMTLCVEALISPEGGDFSIKLEDQVLITETGCENLTKYPFDPRLLGQ
jgi:methionine aminopeptidase